MTGFIHCECIILYSELETNHILNSFFSVRVDEKRKDLTVKNQLLHLISSI